MEQLSFFNPTPAEPPQWELLCQGDPAKLPAAIRQAAPRFRQRLGQRATVAWCHPDALNGVREVEGIELRARANVAYQSWFYLGVDDG
jgi:hypothetical protein